MLRACARLSPGPARAEYRAWLAARPVAPAVAELLDTARGDDALLRGLAFEALRVVGDPAEPAVRAVVDEPTLRPYAVLWLAELDGGDPDTATGLLTREEATWLWVDTAAAVADHGEDHLLVSHLETAVQGSVPGLLEEVRNAGPPAHRPGPGRARRRAPRSGAGQGDAQGGVQGPHRGGVTRVDPGARGVGAVRVRAVGAPGRPGDHAVLGPGRFGPLALRHPGARAPRRLDTRAPERLSASST